MKRVLYACAVILAATTGAFAQTTFYYPHVVDGFGSGITWKTTIFLTNPGAAGGPAASGNISFIQENPGGLAQSGFGFSINLVDEGGNAVTGPTIPFQIAPGQTKKYSSTGANPLAGGFAVVTANSSLNGVAIFSEYDSATGALRGAAGVPAVSAVPKQEVVVDTTEGFLTGVAYVNPGVTLATARLDLLNTDAVTVMTTTQSIGPGNHTQGFTTDFFPGAPAGVGTMRITATGAGTALAAIALRFDPSFAIFTTIPPITVASLVEPALEWFQQKPWLPRFSSLARILAGVQFHLG
jgi:hypothetical protein